MPPTASIPTLLAALGDTPDAIAASLRDRGVIGKRKSACDCPIARYLERNGILGPIADTKYVLYYERFDQKKADFPQAITDFVVAFDASQYPDLEAH